MFQKSCIRRFWTAALFLAASTAVVSAQLYPTYKDLHDFGPSAPAGLFPESLVSFDKAGNMYGTTYGGGAGTNLSGQPCGIVWELTTSGTLIDLHDFPSSTLDGQNPTGSVTIDLAGNLYGATSVGGAHGDALNTDGCGMIWEITTTGKYIDLHDFGVGTDGRTPAGPMSFDGVGNLYGATQDGGANGYGMIWEITAGGKYIDLHDFGADLTDGKVPTGGVTADSAGNLYGITGIGGVTGVGTVWELTTGGTYVDLHDFGYAFSDGQYPEAGVSLDANGNLYGTAEDGGANGDGIVWELTAGGKFLDLHDFGSNPTDGQHPACRVSLDAAGNLYGATGAGGTNGYVDGAHGDGMVWEISTGGKFIDLHDFGSSSTDAIYPLGGVSFDTVGNMYGTSYGGGVNTNSANPTGFGTIWELLVQAPVTLKAIAVSPSSVLGGASAMGTITLTGNAPAGGQGVPLSSSSPSATVPTSVTVPSGASSAAFTISTAAVTSQAAVTITAGIGTGAKTTTLMVTPASLVSVSLNPNSVAGGVNSTGAVTLSGPAGPGGTSIALSSSNAGASVPSSANVPAGATSTTFTVTTKGVNTQITVTITGTLNGVSQSAILTLTPAVLALVSVSPSTVTGATNSTGTVSLTGNAVTGGYTVKLTSSNANASVPASVIIQAGSSTATFTVTTKASIIQQIVTLTATSGSIKKVATLTIASPVLSSISLNPTSVTGGTNSSATVTLTGPAPSGGIAVKLSSSSKSVTVPASVTMPAGKATVSFAVKSTPVATQTSVTITATQGTNSKTATLTVNPPTLLSLTLSPTSVNPGGSSTGKVTLTGPAPSNGLVLTIKSSSSNVTVPTSVKIPTGATAASFAIKASKTSPAGSVTITATLGSASQAATLSIK